MSTATIQSTRHGNVSVVIPAYNGALYIAEALRSILAQTVACREIIVVDDGSTDDTAQVVERFSEASLIRKAHGGIGETLNYGLARVSTEYIAFLDADDRWMPRKTEIQLAALRANPDIDVVFGHARRFLMTPEGERVLDVVPGTTTVGGLFRLNAFKNIGGFAVERHAFIDWFGRASEAGLKYTIDQEIVYERRIHSANDGILRKDEQRKSYHVTLKAILDRRRNTGHPMSEKRRPR
jgi:glycosyltransferase involved in cell wall biosynthesis